MEALQPNITDASMAAPHPAIGALGAAAAATVINPWQVVALLAIAMVVVLLFLYFSKPVSKSATDAPIEVRSTITERIEPQTIRHERIMHMRPEELDQIIQDVASGSSDADEEPTAAEGADNEEEEEEF